jgi:hypothetical protein
VATHSLMTLFKMAAENDSDFDDMMFQDGRGEVIFVADSEVEHNAGFLLNRYLDYVDRYEHLHPIHPSDCSGTSQCDYSGPSQYYEEEDDEAKERERLKNGNVLLMTSPRRSLDGGINSCTSCSRTAQRNLMRHSIPADVSSSG